MQSFGSFHTYLATKLTLLRAACITEAAIGNGDDGASCFFMVNGSNPNNGIIPSSSFGVARPLGMIDLDATAKAESVEQTVMGGLPDLLCQDINARIDRSIVAALENCTFVETVEGSNYVLDTMARSDVKLGNNCVSIEEEDNMFALVTPDMRSLMLEKTEFCSGDYVNIKGGSREYRVWRWVGKNWLVGPSYLKHAYIFHRKALGHALDLSALAFPGAVTGGVDADGIGWMKAKTRERAEVLQPTGVVRITSNGAKP